MKDWWEYPRCGRRFIP